jgi:methylmalonyl-CoA mutase
VRFVTAASLFDGHDASINIMRRILQGMGCGGDPPRAQPLGGRGGRPRRCRRTCRASPVSSYQGGHVEYFKYMVDLLRQRGGAHIQVFGGGGGVIVPAEIARAAGLRRRAHLLARGRPAAWACRA